MTEALPSEQRAAMQDSLLAELAAARQSAGDQPQRAASTSTDSAAPQRSGGLLARVFAYGCIAMILDKRAPPGA